MTMHRNSMRIPSPPLSAPARHHGAAEGWRRMAIVFAGAAIGGFFVWLLIRGAFVQEPMYQEPPERPYSHTKVVPYGYPQGGGAGRNGRADAAAGAYGDQSRQWHRECHADRSGHVTCGPQQDGDLPPRRR
jgi:hypothetical protein